VFLKLGQRRVFLIGDVADTLEATERAMLSRLIVCRCNTGLTVATTFFRASVVALSATPEIGKHFWTACVAPN